MTSAEKIQQILEERRNAQPEADYDAQITRALIRAGITILCGYAIGTLIGIVLARL